MSKIKCPLCGKTIKQRDRIIRVVAEMAEKANDDSPDPEEWSKVIDWTSSYVAHSECTREELALRQDLVEIPYEADIGCLFDGEKDVDRDKQIILKGL